MALKLQAVWKTITYYCDGPKGDQVSIAEHNTYMHAYWELYAKIICEGGS